jgi:glucose uptake protein GlcU
MKRNMGLIDRSIRTLVAALLAVLYFFELLPTPWQIVLGVVAVIFLLTSALGFCPLYLPFGIRTCPAKKE